MNSSGKKSNGAQNGFAHLLVAFAPAKEKNINWESFHSNAKQRSHLMNYADPTDDFYLSP